VLRFPEDINSPVFSLDHGRNDRDEVMHLMRSYNNDPGIPLGSFNYDATKEALARAIKGEPKAAEVTAKKDKVKHPFAAG